jgi:hypothetical protein
MAAVLRAAFVLVALILALTFVSGVASAQTVSGQISGIVADAQGGVIAGTAMELMNELTEQVREFRTESSGGFLFPNLVPG